MNLINHLICWWTAFWNVSTWHAKGFYYDAYYKDQTLNEEHFGIIESQAKKAVAVCFEF
jgi:hypothetical protein